jgi:hypothetical protein
MVLRIGDDAPDFEADTTTCGLLHGSSYLGRRIGVVVRVSGEMKSVFAVSCPKSTSRATSCLCGYSCAVAHRGP